MDSEKIIDYDTDFDQKLEQESFPSKILPKKKSKSRQANKRKKFRDASPGRK